MNVTFGKFHLQCAKCTSRIEKIGFVRCDKCHTYYCDVNCKDLDSSEHNETCLRDNIVDVYAPKKENNCSFCDTENCTLKCGKCVYTYYCGAECQKKDWKLHKTICAVESAKHKLNDLFLDTLTDSQGVYVSTHNHVIRRFIISDIFKYLDKYLELVEDTNKIIIRTSNEFSGKSKGNLKHKGVVKTVNNFKNYVQSLESKYSLSYKPCTLEEWKNGIKNFNIMDMIPKMKQGYLKKGPVKLIIKDGSIINILTPKEEISNTDTLFQGIVSGIISEINNKYIKLFDNVIKIMEENTDREYYIDILECIDCNFGCYFQYNYITTKTKNELDYIIGKVFIFSTK